MYLFMPYKRVYLTIGKYYVRKIILIVKFNIKHCAVKVHNIIVIIHNIIVLIIQLFTKHFVIKVHIIIIMIIQNITLIRQ